jgi:hypothetical protein
LLKVVAFAFEGRIVVASGSVLPPVVGHLFQCGNGGIEQNAPIKFWNLDTENEK